ncbi:MAG: DEAD/DEAH box helicase [Candidatus Doudnabacteria bacterium]|nr:DEAD/DEAH box helicase [Candidatus Doudnabacteria bacterium]
MEELIKKLKTDKEISVSEYKQLLEHANYLLNSAQEFYNDGLSILCRIAERNPEDKLIKQLLYDCVIASRVFIYKDMLKKTNPVYSEGYGSIFDSIAEGHYTLDSGTTLTKEQKIILDEYDKNHKLIVSAPTSFGKSRIVPEIIHKYKYKNIAIVLPTIALLNETFVNFKNSTIFSGYNLVNSLTSPVKEKSIVILTPEKMDLFLDENPELKFDFFVMDEIYKIQDDPERKKIFTHSLYRLSKIVPNFYLIGPYFKSFSSNFIKKTGAKFIKFKTEIVQKDIHKLHLTKTGETYSVSNVPIEKSKQRNTNLFRIIEGINGQHFVYVATKRTAESITKLLAKRHHTSNASDLTKYIEEHIAVGWSLSESLKKGVAFHHGSIPRYIQREIMDSFNDGELSTIVCTSTLIEGVNTSAKNVILYDNHKGNENVKLSNLDIKNIKGRAGRLAVHFVGRFISLVDYNDLNEDENVEFSYYDNNNLEPEETVQADTEDLKEQNLNKRLEVERILEENQIPLSLIKKNKFINIDKQINLIKFLRANNQLKEQLACHNSLPKKEQFNVIFSLCYDYLFSDVDKNDRSFSKDKLNWLTNFYVYLNPPLKLLIEKQTGKSIDTKVRGAFKLITKYFEFLLPKYLVVFENIFNFVFDQEDKVLNLKLLITKLEFGFLGTHEIVLKESGVPNSIIRKVSKLFEGCETLVDIRNRIQDDPSTLEVLTNYEKKIFNKYI